MKNKNYSPYGTYSLNKIDAPKPKTAGPKASKTVGKDDLRGGKRK